MIPYETIVEEEEEEEAMTMMNATGILLESSGDDYTQSLSSSLDDNPYYPHYKSEDISSLLPIQDKILSLVPFGTGLMSAIGSSCIIYMIFSPDEQNKKKRNTPYRRILLGLSVCDLISSLTYPFQNFLLPASTSQRVYAMGNDATCTAMGFLTQFFFASVLYNLMLSLYFLCTVRFGIRDEIFARKFEPVMHIVAVGYPLTCSFVGLGLGVFGEILLGSGCWIAEWPKGCGGNPEENEQQQQCYSTLIGWIFGGFPILIAFVVIVTDNLVVYCHVRKTIVRARRFQTTRPTRTTNSLRDSSGRTATSTTSRSSISRKLKASLTKRLRSSSLRSTMGRDRGQDSQTKRIRAVAVQATLYVVVFLFTYVPTVVLRFFSGHDKYSAQDEDKLFPLLLIQSICFPLQGFFNFFVFVRPSYLRTRKEYPYETRIWVLRRALYGDRIQPTTRSTDPSSSSSSSSSLPPCIIDLFQLVRRWICSSCCCLDEDDDDIHRAMIAAQRPRHTPSGYRYSSATATTIRASCTNRMSSVHDNEDGGVEELMMLETKRKRDDDNDIDIPPPPPPPPLDNNGSFPPAGAFPLVIAFTSEEESFDDEPPPLKEGGDVMLPTLGERDDVVPPPLGEEGAIRLSLEAAVDDDPPYPPGEGDVVPPEQATGQFEGTTTTATSLSGGTSTPVGAFCPEDRAGPKYEAGPPILADETSCPSDRAHCPPREESYPSEEAGAPREGDDSPTQEGRDETKPKLAPTVTIAKSFDALEEEKPVIAAVEAKAIQTQRMSCLKMRMEELGSDDHCDNDDCGPIMADELSAIRERVLQERNRKKKRLGVLRSYQTALLQICDELKAELLLDDEQTSHMEEGDETEEESQQQQQTTPLSSHNASIHS